MEVERCYDYSIGLNTPYWVQEWRNKRGEVVFRFNTPKEMSFFVVFLIALFVKVVIHQNTPIFDILANMTFRASLVLWFFIPQQVARIYCEFEPDGKKMHVYLSDMLRHYYCFVFNSKGIYNGVRIGNTVDVMVFEKTNL